MAHENVYGICESKCKVIINGTVAGISVPASGWTSQDDGSYACTIAVDGIQERDFPVYLDLDWENCSGDVSDLVKNKGYIYKFSYKDGTITLFATKQPDVDLVVRIIGVGIGEGVSA